MNRSLHLLAVLALVSSSCTRDGPAEDPGSAIDTIPVIIGDSRDEVIASMGMPNAASSGDENGEVLDVVITAPGPISKEEMERLEKESTAAFEADPTVRTASIWRYYGHGGNDQFAAIYFKADTVIGITHGMTQDMIGNEYAR